MDTLRGHIKRIPELLAPKIDGIKTNFDEWKVPWTAGRASKIDNLDARVSTRSTQVSVDELILNVGETADTGGGVNEGTAMAKLNKLLSKRPLYEDYDIQTTNYAGLTSAPLKFLNVSGGAVLIGYSVDIPAYGADPDIVDGIIVKISVDGVPMYDMNHKTRLDRNYSRTTNVFSSFDDNFLFNVYENNSSRLYDEARLITPSETPVRGIDSNVPRILVKPPIAQDSLIVEAFKDPGATGNITLSIFYGVKK